MMDLSPYFKGCQPARTAEKASFYYRLKAGRCREKNKFLLKLAEGRLASARK
jgi:hypothetical protein